MIATGGAFTLYVGVAGDITIVTLEGDTVQLVAVPAGSFVPIACKQVNKSGTTADSMVALW